jgi:hypothetical protein
MVAASVLPLVLVLAACAGEEPVPPELLRPVPKATAPPRAATAPAANPRVRAMRPIHEPVGQGRRAAALARLRSASRAATRDTFDGYLQGVEQTFEWVPGESYDVIMAKDKTTTIRLWPGEAYNNHSFGKSTFFGIDTTWSGLRGERLEAMGPSASMVPVIAFERGKCTNLELYTTWRTILLNLCSIGTADAYNRVVTWAVPQEEQALHAAGLAGNPTPMDAVTGAPVDQLDSRFEITGDPVFRPGEWSAMTDNRRHTYLVPPADLGFMPVPHLVKDGGGETAQYEARRRRQGDGVYLDILASPPPRAIGLQYGDRMMHIRKVGR